MHTSYVYLCNDKGLKRKNNEDNFFCNGIYMHRDTLDLGTGGSMRNNDPVQLYAVCDGMGGEAAGEEAALTAVEMMVPLLKRLRTQSDVHTCVDDYVMDVNDKIATRPLVRGAGTTLAMLAFHHGTATAAFLGDSRIYLLRNGELQLISQDHTEERAMAGVASAHIAKARNTLTRYLGMDIPGLVIRPSYARPLSIRPDDVFLLCSDGITDMITEDEIIQVLYCGGQSPAKALVRAALGAGGVDNATAIVIHIRADSAH